MNTDRVEIFRRLQCWMPPYYYENRRPGEFLKSEVVSILTKLLQNSWGRNFNQLTLKYEEELIAACSACDDENVYVKYSVIPAIIRNLQPHHYQCYLNQNSYIHMADITNHNISILRMLEEINILIDKELSILDAAHLSLRVPDIHGSPIQYVIQLPEWMHDFVVDESEYNQFGDPLELIDKSS